MGASDTQVVDNLHERDHKEKGAFISRCTETYSKSTSMTLFFTDAPTSIANKKWKPPALRAPVLILTILTCWSLIAVLQVLLNRSQRDSGIIFATRISDLPLKDAFLYLYFPTVVAVTISIHWTWIDVETKRVEPYYQLSKPEGALGRDSLLLEYPFDFLPLVPIKALKNR